VPAVEREELAGDALEMALLLLPDPVV